jgi:hypothetical protein
MTFAVFLYGKISAQETEELEDMNSAPRAAEFSFRKYQGDAARGAAGPASAAGSALAAAAARRAKLRTFGPIYMAHP